jgi:hypothetical protein
MKLAFTFPLLLLATLATSCTFTGADRKIEGVGPQVQTERSLQAFERISMAGGMELDILVGEEQSVVIHADQNLHEYIETHIDGDTLKIRFTETISSSNDLRAEIRVPHLAAISIAGSSKMTIGGIEAEAFSIDLSGSTRATMTGQVVDLSVDVAGSCRLDLSALEAKAVSIDIAGSGKVEVAASDSLDVDVAGSAVVTYHGQPALTIDQAGSAKVRPASAKR